MDRFFFRDVIDQSKFAYAIPMDGLTSTLIHGPLEKEKKHKKKWKNPNCTTGCVGKIHIICWFNVLLTTTKP